MFRNYLKVAWRHLRRHRLYTIINVVGLALGFAVTLLILLFVQDEWTHDAFHEKGDRIYRTIGKTAEGDVEWTATMDGPLGPLLGEHLPQVEHVARVNHQWRQVILDNQPVEQEVLFVDPSFLKLFTFPFVAGDPSTALDSPDDVVLTEEAARRFFGDINPLGRALPVEFRDEVYAMTVAGVVQNVPRTSSLQFDLLVPIRLLSRTAHPMLGDDVLRLWRMRVADTYVLLEEGAEPARVESLIAQVVERYRSDLPMAGTSAPTIDTLALQPLAEVYLSPEVSSRVTVSSRPLYAYVLIGIGALVLLLACINFTALAVGRSANRAKEVGVRKVAGALPGQIRKRFWSEALLTTVLAVLAGLLLASLALPAFNALAGKSLTLAPLASLSLLALIIGGVLIVSLVAAGYPAWILARIRPTEALRGQTSSRRQHKLIQGLVVIQFSLSLALLIGAFGMARQLHFVQQTDLGFDQEQIIAIRNRTDIDTPDLIARLRQELRPYPSIQQVSGTGSLSGRPSSSFTVVAGDSMSTRVYQQIVEKHFREVMGIDLLAGRDFPPGEIHFESAAVLVNEAFLRALHWTPEEAFGTYLDLEAGNITLPAGEIIGVVENYHYQSLHHAVEPLVLSLPYDVGGLGYALVRLNSEDEVAQSLRRVEAAWNSIAPDEPFSYRFLDETVQAQYETDRRWATIVSWTVALALLISCSGLFSMSALVATRRTKEIGVRKVLGASTGSIVVLLSKDFIKLVVIAFVIATPLAYYAMSRWLENFAYRIDLGLWIFLGAGVLAMLIALFTVSYQSVKAALSDPVDSLRHE